MQNFPNGIASYNQPESDMTYVVNHVIIAQYGMKRGLELFRDAGVKAIEKEMKQLYDQNVISPVHVSVLTKQQKNWAPLYLMFLKQKRDGNNQRARMCRRKKTTTVARHHGNIITNRFD